jgi:hypothetical protein
VKGWAPIALGERSKVKEGHLQCRLIADSSDASSKLKAQSGKVKGERDDSIRPAPSSPRRARGLCLSYGSRVEVGMRDKDIEDGIRRFAVFMGDSTVKTVFDISVIQG